MKILDVVWMLVRTPVTPPGQQLFSDHPEVVYEIGASAKEVWDKVLERETMGTIETKKSLKKKGYRAKKVSIGIDCPLVLDRLRR